jgi:valyl-tRNA synthetase
VSVSSDPAGPSACEVCGRGAAELQHDPDIFDTWFSSGLWPFSTLGWPDATGDFARFYPTSVMETAHEILFFWVARMMMLGLHLTDREPFRTVYLSGLIRDAQGLKMSKTKGNVVDPLSVMEESGADALRFAVIHGSTPGLDQRFGEQKLESGRNFANKLWNAGRFILTNLEGPTRALAGRSSDVIRRDDLTLADRWIIARCDATVAEATEAYQRFRLNEAAAAVYHFIWSDLADWYIEQVKPRLYGHLAGGDVARAVVAQTFEVALRLLHPIMPFITEALWRRFPGRPESASISVAPWPTVDPRARDPEAVKQFGLVQELVSAIRAIRAEYGVQPGQTVRAVMSEESKAATAALKQERSTIIRLAKLSELSVGESSERVGGHAVLSDGTAVFVPLGDTIDVGRECGRLGTEVDRLGKLVESQQRKLGNEQFVSRAPADVVDRERQKLATWKDQREVLVKKRELLGCS